MFTNNSGAGTLRVRQQLLVDPGVFQVVYKEKDSDKAPDSWTVDGNTSHSVQLSGLGKYVLYEIQVLAFTRIGDGRSSTPPILERTLDDGAWIILNDSAQIFLFGSFLVRFKPFW